MPFKIKYFFYKYIPLELKHFFYKYMPFKLKYFIYKYMPFKPRYLIFHTYIYISHIWKHNQNPFTRNIPSLKKKKERKKSRVRTSKMQKLFLKLYFSQSPAVSLLNILKAFGQGYIRSATEC